MVPLEGFASYVEGYDGESLVIDNLVIVEEMFDLKHPAKDILTSELGNF